MRRDRLVVTCLYSLCCQAFKLTGVGLSFFHARIDYGFLGLKGTDNH